VLCGVPNHGIHDSDDDLDSEFNGRGPFLRGLNEGESEVTLTLRSDGIDEYAQADSRFVGKPGTPTGITAEGPAPPPISGSARSTIARRHFLRARFARSTNSSQAANRTGSRSRRKRKSN
jgi:hypothetical protein